MASDGAGVAFDLAGKASDVAGIALDLPGMASFKARIAFDLAVFDSDEVGIPPKVVVMA